MKGIDWKIKKENKKQSSQLHHVGVSRNFVKNSLTHGSFSNNQRERIEKERRNFFMFLTTPPTFILISQPASPPRKSLLPCFPFLSTFSLPISLPFYSFSNLTFTENWESRRKRKSKFQVEIRLELSIASCYIGILTIISKWCKFAGNQTKIKHNILGP